MKTKEGTYRFRIKRYDTGLSTQNAVGNMRRAVADGAVAIIDEGTGLNASWRIAADADRPIGITYQGGVGLVDPVERANVFRIAPTDHGMAFRFAEYLIPKGLKIGLVVDDSSYGQEGLKALRQAFAVNPRTRSRSGSRSRPVRRTSLPRCCGHGARARRRSSSGPNRRRSPA